MPKAIGVKKPHDRYKDNNRPQIFSMKNANANAFKSLSHISYYFASHLCSLLGCLIVLFLFLYRYQRYWFIPHCGLCHSAFHACCVMCNQSAHIFAYILNALKPCCAKLRYLGTNCKFFGPKVKSTCTSLQKSQYLDGNIKYQGTITCWAYWRVSSYVFRSIKLNPCLLNKNNAIKQQDILVFLLNINCLHYMKFVNNHKIQMVYFSYCSRSFSFGSRSSFVHPPFILRSGIEDWSKNERRIIGGKTEMYRNSNGRRRERRPEYLSPTKCVWKDKKANESKCAKFQCFKR